MQWTGQTVSFFYYSIKPTNNICFLKFVIVDKTKRGKGYRKEILNLALQYAFQITDVRVAQWNVFSENTLAKQCYKKVGFVERTINKNVFSYKDELWSRCNMISSKQSHKFSERTHNYGIRRVDKEIRTFRGLTQRELGLKLGYDERNADVRISQY